MKATILFLFLSLATFAQQDTISKEECLENISYEKVSKFLARHWAQAKRVQQETGVPGGICLAQMALESGWGTSEFYIVRKNCLGIKLNHKYCWFKTHDDCLKIYVRTLNNSCYKDQQPESIEEWLDALVACKYAQSERYKSKLSYIIRKYNLHYL